MTVKVKALLVCPSTMMKRGDSPGDAETGTSKVITSLPSSTTSNVSATVEAPPAETMFSAGTMEKPVP